MLFVRFNCIVIKIVIAISTWKRAKHKSDIQIACIFKVIAEVSGWRLGFFFAAVILPKNRRTNRVFVEDVLWGLLKSGREIVGENKGEK